MYRYEFATDGDYDDALRYAEQSPEDEAAEREAERFQRDWAAATEAGSAAFVAWARTALAPMSREDRRVWSNSRRADRNYARYQRLAATVEY